jgi:hypothetical protein
MSEFVSNNVPFVILLSFICGVAFALVLLAGHLGDIARAQNKLVEMMKWRRGE